MCGGINGGRIVGEQLKIEQATLFKNRDYPVLTDYRAMLQNSSGVYSASKLQAFSASFPACTQPCPDWRSHVFAGREAMRSAAAAPQCIGALNNRANFFTISSTLARTSGCWATICPSASRIEMIAEWSNPPLASRR